MGRGGFSPPLYRNTPRTANKNAITAKAVIARAVAFTVRVKAFAFNYRTLFVLSRSPAFMGKVEYGLLTPGNNAPRSAERISLSVPYGFQ
jgi:hypothetical protein